MRDAEWFEHERVALSGEAGAGLSRSAADPEVVRLRARVAALEASVRETLLLYGLGIDFGNLEATDPLCARLREEARAIRARAVAALRG